MLRKLGLAATMLAGLTLAGHAETLKWGAARDIYSLDPYSYGDSYTLSFLNHIYEGLVRYDAELKIEPALAESWENVSETVWRFHLRKGVKFHDGADFNADDVLASLKRVSDPVSPLRGNLPAYKSSKKVDDYTIDIELSGPYPLLLNDLTNIHIFDAGWLKTNNSEKPTDVGAKIEGYATYHTNGTGPFKLESRVPDSKTILVKNPDWWDKTSKSNIDRIEFNPITSAATRVAALLSGEVNFTESAPSQDLPRLQAQPDLKVMERTDLRTVMMGFNRKPKLDNGSENKFNDLRVRQAFAHSLDRDLIQKRIMRGKSRSAGAVVAPEIPGYTPELDTTLAYDPALSKKLLAEAGATDFPFTLVCTTDAYVNEEELCQGLVNMLSRGGFKPQLDIAPTAAQAPKRTGGKADVYIIGWATEPMLDSYSILLQMIETKTDNAGVFNWGGWSYPEIDKLVIEASTEMDRSKRLALQTKALQMVKDEIVMLPLHQQPMAWVMSNKIDHIVQLPDNKPRHWLTHFAE
ncbi:peptide/nickel transport system substrate-binding protein [Ochrobactrum sp. 19YEA23]|uniref:ABC transporter substrate-binding protein n=1 Tax=Ochrobactrum sp. 19YEA23 TaxID=3039854 RepID=UPI0024795700|nr:peptide/nickel transport system substrate-binding protein [Ochrobactrum sp. 19YEA23]